MVGLMCTGGKKDVAPLARRAIKGLAAMLTKDRCLQYQSETDALKVCIPPFPAFPRPRISTHLTHPICMACGLVAPDVEGPAGPKYTSLHFPAAFLPPWAPPSRR